MGSRAQVIAELEEKGFGGTFDFLYMPRDYSTHSTKGYAVINFKSVKEAATFKRKFQTTSWSYAIDVGNQQGLAKNVQSVMRKSRTKDPLNLPLIFTEAVPKGVPLTRELIQ